MVAIIDIVKMFMDDMNNIKQPPWRIVDKLYTNKESADKDIMLKILEKESDKLMNKQYSDVCNELGKYEHFKKTLLKSKKYQQTLENSYNTQNYYSAEAILRLMPEEYKLKKPYTVFLDSCLKKLYGRWNSAGSIGLTQMMLVHHPIREIKMAGLEILQAHDIGDGSADDLTSKLCAMTNCRFIVTEYIDQEYHGYRQSDPYCPSHGKIYNDDSRKYLKERWDTLVNRL